MLDPTDKREIPQKVYDLIRELLKTPYLFRTDCGEEHRGGKLLDLNEVNVKPCFLVSGKIGVTIPRNSYGDLELTSISDIEKLVNNKSFDASFSTGNSFIKREWTLYENKEDAHKPFEY